MQGKVALSLFLAFLLSFQLLFCNLTIHPRVDTAEAVGGWLVYHEGKDKSTYRFNISKYVSGLEIWLYIKTDDSYAEKDQRVFNNDWIQLTLVSKPVLVIDAEGQKVVEPIVGFTKIGYKGDREKSVGGIHGIYYALPKSSFVSYINITLYAIRSTPRLDVSRSFVKEWEPYIDIIQQEIWSKGWYKYTISEDGKGRISLVSFGTPVGSQPMSSGLTWFFGKKIRMPSLAWKPDVYIEVGYAGGINIAPESFVGTGNYKCKINVGISQILDGIVIFDRQETVYMIEKGQKPELVADEAASGCTDILLEILEKISESPALKKAFETLGYALFILDLIDIISTLGFDQTVAESKILVFKDVPISENLIAYFNSYVEIASAGLSGGIVNFWGEFPFGSSIFDNLGFSVTNLPDGGMQIGGILLDYHDPYPTEEKIITIRPDGQINPLTWRITTSNLKVYHLVDDIEAIIRIVKDNTILDGCNHKLRGGVAITQISGSCIKNVTVKSLKVEGGLDGYEFYKATGVWTLILKSFDKHGILLNDVLGVKILNCSITGCQVGIAIIGAKSSIILGNKITSAGLGIGIYLRNGHYCASTEQNTIYENIISSCGTGIFDDECWGPNNITRNHLIYNVEGVRAEGVMETISYNKIIQCERGIVCVSRTGEKTILGNVIVNCTSGIDMWGSTVQILRNRLINCVEFGIRSDGCNVSENEIINCTQGVVGGGTISGNNIVKCTYGISYSYGNITNNNIADASIGIYLTGEKITARQIPIKVQRNNIVSCHKGTVVEELNGVVISGNNYMKNEFGICMAAGWNKNHMVSENNFLMNKVSILIETDYLTDVIAYIFHNNFVGNEQAYGDPPRCVWDSGYPAGGNYWSDYVGKDEKSGANQDRAGGDGIGDEPYVISGKAIDRYPLMEPTSELPATTSSRIIQGQIFLITSNSAISNFKYDLESQTLSFQVQGKSGTKGFVNLVIPKSIARERLEVLFDGKPIPFSKSEDAGNVKINFTYKHSKHYIEVRFGIEEKATPKPTQPSPSPSPSPSIPQSSQLVYSLELNSILIVVIVALLIFAILLYRKRRVE